MCARTTFEGQCALTDTDNFEYRLANFKMTSYTLGEAGEEEQDKLILHIPKRRANAADTVQISSKDNNKDDDDDDKEDYENNDYQVSSRSDREVDIGYAEEEDDENQNDSEDDYVDTLRVRLVNFDNEEEDFDYDENQFSFFRRG